MNWEVLIAIGIGLGVYAVLAYFRGWFPFKKAKQPVRTTAPGIVLPDSFAFQYTRPDGGFVLSVYEIPESVRDAVMQRIISGLQRSIDAARHHFPDWQRGMTTASVGPIAFIEPMATSSQGFPTLMVGPYQTAGTVINVGDSSGNEIGEPYIVAPAQRNWNFLDYLEATMHNENEHRLEWLNDKPLFWTYTGGEDVHPHRSVPTMHGFAAIRLPQPKCCGRFRTIANHVPVVLKVSAER